MSDFPYVPDPPEREGGTMTAYVVQEAVDLEDGQWRDIATVEVPCRSKAKRAIEAALREFPATEGDYPITLRVLDERAAREHVVALKAGEPEWEIA